MNAQIAYEAYRDSLKARTRKWHELKEEHADKSDDAFDCWLKENKNPEELGRYFMGNYDAMPEHSIAGWVAFAESASNGAEDAWNSYATAAHSNFHGDSDIILPRYDELAADQKEAVESAVAHILEHSPFPCR